MMISTTRQSARDIYEAGGATMRNVWMGEADDAIRVFYGDVVQNDSPTCGRDDERCEKDGRPWSPYEPIADGVVLRMVVNGNETR